MNPRSLFAAALAVLGCVLEGPLWAQSPAPTAKPSQEEYITEKGFKSTILELRHRDPSDLVLVLRPLSSGFKGATLSANREYHTISVRDFPENIAAIETAIKRLDVAEPPQVDVELRLYVLIAANGESGGAKYPEELAQAVAALKSTLQYRSYALGVNFIARVRDGSRNVGGAGTADLADPTTTREERQPLQADYQIGRVTLDSSGQIPVVKLDGFSLSLVGVGSVARAQIRSDVTLRESEKVVVGTSTMRGKGLVVVLTARVIR